MGARWFKGQRLTYGTTLRFFAVCAAVGALGAQRFDLHSSSRSAHVTARTGPYTVVPVTRGATLTGAVRWEGALPSLAPEAVPPALVQAHPACGTSINDETLVVEPNSRGVQGAVVYLADIASGAAVVPTPAVMEQQGCRFTPHVLAVSAGSPVRFGNADRGVLHNVHLYEGVSGETEVFNLATPSGLSVTRALEREGVHRAVCDVGHTWMLAYLHVFDHPYFAVTDAQGQYRIANVPAGTYRLRVWHEGWTAPGAALDPRGRRVHPGPVEAEVRVVVRSGVSLTNDAVYSAAPAARFVRAPAR